MGRGGPRPGTGGARKGAGRKALPRLSPEATRAAVAELAGGDSPEARASLASRLGLQSAEAIRAAIRNGATQAQIDRWRAVAPTPTGDPMKTILLVPNAPDSPLLAPGRAGAMPPIWVYVDDPQMSPDYIRVNAIRQLRQGWQEVAPTILTGGGSYEEARVTERALVLALDEPVPEGMDRAARVLAAHLGRDFYLGVLLWTREFFAEDLCATNRPTTIPDSAGDAWDLATVCAARLDCRVVIL